MISHDAHLAIPQKGLHLVDKDGLASLTRNLEANQYVTVSVFRLDIERNEGTRSIIVFGDRTGAAHRHAFCTRLYGNKAHVHERYTAAHIASVGFGTFGSLARLSA